MNKIWLIAQRDFLTTVSNKGFLFGLFIMPLMIGLAVLFGPRLLSATRSPQVVGRVAVMDPTGQVLPELRSTLSVSAIKARQEENARRALADVPEANRAMAERGMQAAQGSVPDLTIEERPADAASWQTGWPPRSNRCRPPIQRAGRSRSSSSTQTPCRRTDPAGEFGTYDLYASRGPGRRDGDGDLSSRCARRSSTSRLGAAKLDQQQVDAMTRVQAAELDDRDRRRRAARAAEVHADAAVHRRRAACSSA